MINPFYEADGVGGGAESATTEPVGVPGQADNATQEKTVPTGVLDPTAVEPVVPEEYTFNIPDGLVLDEEMKNTFSALAKEAKLPQEHASKLLDLHSKIMLDVIKKQEETVDGWVSESQKQGLVTKDNIAFAKTAVDTFGGGEAMQVLMDTGAINHPAILKMFQTIGGMLSEDKPIDGQPPNTKEPTIAEMFFPGSGLK